jgi:hypothetical protein
MPSAQLAVAIRVVVIEDTPCSPYLPFQALKRTIRGTASKLAKRGIREHQ